MLTNGRFDLKDIGCYRTYVDPMQVVSGAIHAPRIHFEAPPSTDVPSDMERFIGWFNRTAPASPARLPALTRAGIAHLYFESIHPFEDGNGRIGRAIAEMALSQGFGRPTLIALAATMLAKRRAYYNALEACGKRNEITSWLVWFAATTLEAQHATLHMAEFLIGKTRLLDRLVGQLNERQEKVLLRVLREGPEGFAGGLSARNYMSIAGVPTATATRDLSDMVTKGALVRTGARRHARYHLPISVGPPVSIEITADGDVLYAPSL